MKTLIECHFQRVGQLHKQKMASEGRKFDEKKKFSNDPRMCSEALGVALSVSKHLGTVLTSLDSIWDNLKKIEKMKFFASKF